MVALLLIALLAASWSCDSGLRVVTPGTTGGGGTGGGGTGGGGTGGTGGSNALVGTWRSLQTLTLSSGETLVLDVRWSFDAGARCSRTRIETLISGNSGTESTETLLCTYTLTASTVTVTFQGSSVPSQFSVAFAGNDLLLDGTRFTRIG